MVPSKSAKAWRKSLAERAAKRQSYHNGQHTNYIYGYTNSSAIKNITSKKKQASKSNYTVRKLQKYPLGKRNGMVPKRVEQINQPQHEEFA